MGTVWQVLLALGIVAAALIPASASPANPESFVISDDTGDVETATDSPVGVPGASFTDLVEFRIENEDPLRFDLVWKLAAFQDHTGTVPRSGFLRLATWFQFEPLGDLRAMVFARVSIEESGGFGFGDSESTFCATTGFEDCPGRSFSFRFDVPSREVRATILKSGFPRTSENDVPPVGQGALLKGVAAGVRFDTPVTPVMRQPAIPTLMDLASGAPKDYTMRHTQGNRALRFDSAPHGNRDAAPTAAGLNQTFALNLTNPTPIKQLVNLTYDLVAPPGWTAGGPRAIAVPAKGNRTFSYWIHVPVEAVPFTQGILTLRGSSLLDPTLLAFQPITVEAANRLTPETPRLYLHADAASCQVEGGPLGETVCDDGDLSSFKDDPRRATPDEVAFERSFGIVGGVEAGRGFDMDHALGAPTQVEKGEVHLVLKLRSERDLRGVEVHMSLMADPPRAASVELLRATVTKDIGTTETTIDMRANTKVTKPLLLDRGSAFRLLVNFDYPEAAPGVADFPLVVARGTESYLDLPLSAPHAEAVAVTNGAFQVAFAGDDQLFVNPGEHAAFRVAILNQDLIQRRATIVAATDRPEYSAEVRPAAAFDLEPGQGIVVGVLALAPASAKEGERANVTIRVTDEVGQALERTGLLLVAQGVDLADALKEYQDDHEAKERAVRPAGKRTPSLDVLCVLALVGPAMFMRRRCGSPRNGDSLMAFHVRLS